MNLLYDRFNFHQLFDDVTYDVGDCARCDSYTTFKVLSLA